MNLLFQWEDFSHVDTIVNLITHCAFGPTLVENVTLRTHPLLELKPFKHQEKFAFSLSPKNLSKKNPPESF